MTPPAQPFDDAVPRPAAGRLPAPLFAAQPISRSLLDFRDRHTDSLRSVQEGLLVPGEYVLGYRLPPWQRPAVWSEAQQVRLVESAILGLTLGAVVITERLSVHHLRQQDARVPDPLDRLLIDGQQRLRAVQRFLDGDLRVFGLTWPDLSSEDATRLLITVSFGFVQLGSEYTEDQLKSMYARLNWGGTPHTDADRARLGDFTDALPQSLP